LGCDRRPEIFEIKSVSKLGWRLDPLAATGHRLFQAYRECKFFFVGSHAPKFRRHPGLLDNWLLVTEECGCLVTPCRSHFPKESNMSEKNDTLKQAAAVGTGGVAGAGGALAAVSAGGAVTGLGMTGVTSGLAALGGLIGGTMVTGLVIVAAAPITGALVGWSGYKLYKSRKP
jgi:hypothetical protein